jgi:hypothetical protein
LNFKKTGDMYFVRYEENGDIKTLKTESEPERELQAAAGNTALALLKLFGISDAACKLQPVEWKDGEKAGSKCVLLSGESQFGQFKTALPKVSAQEAETPEEGVYDPGGLKNRYNEAAALLREEVKRFALGARRQREIAFTGGEEEGGKKRRGFLKSAAGAVGGLFNPLKERPQAEAVKKGDT